jgi:predicted PurR-regulated permease PerM
MKLNEKDIYNMVYDRLWKKTLWYIISLTLIVFVGLMMVTIGLGQRNNSITYKYTYSSGDESLSISSNAQLPNNLIVGDNKVYSVDKYIKESANNNDGDFVGSMLLFVFGLILFLVGLVFIIYRMIELEHKTKYAVEQYKVNNNIEDVKIFAGLSSNMVVSGRDNL